MLAQLDGPLSFCCACLAAAGSTDCITEHCIQVARVKHAGQAAFLVGKLKKYTGLLPAAQAKFEQQLELMTQHTREQRLPFVLRMLEALRAHAKGAATLHLVQYVLHLHETCQAGIPFECMQCGLHVDACLNIAFATTCK